MLARLYFPHLYRYNVCRLSLKEEKDAVSRVISRLMTSFCLLDLVPQVRTYRKTCLYTLTTDKIKYTLKTYKLLDIDKFVNFYNFRSHHGLLPDLQFPEFPIHSSENDLFLTYMCYIGVMNVVVYFGQ